MRILYVIPARGGSKGIPGKNIKLLNGVPLLDYTLSFARNFASEEDICISTDDLKIIRIAEQFNYKVPFVRAASLAGDEASMQDVLLDAVSFYERRGRVYDTVLLLQPTSPFRTIEDMKAMIKLYEDHGDSPDMVVSVGKAKTNPYFNLFEESDSGWLCRIKGEDFQNRQQCPPIYYFNGSIYIINVNSLKSERIAQFKKIEKYVMDEVHSIDIDSDLDWLLCETILKNTSKTHLKIPLQPFNTGLLNTRKSGI